MYPFRIKPLVKIIRLMLVFEGLFMLTCVPFSLYYGSADLVPNPDFSRYYSRNRWIDVVCRRKYDEHEIGKREGYLIVSLTWVIISLFGALPFYICGAIPSFTDAYFETMSGFSTTSIPYSVTY